MQVSVIKKIRQISKIEEEKKMKLPELKKRFTRKYVIRIIAGVLVVGMVGTGVSTANVFAAKTAQESTESTESTEKDSEKDDGRNIRLNHRGHFQHTQMIHNSLLKKRYHSIQSLFIFL